MSVNSLRSLMCLNVRGNMRGMGRLDPEDSRPPYRQIAEALRRRIRSGDLAPGARLPAVHELAEEYGVAPGTANSAIAALREEGLVFTQHGKGSFVRSRSTETESEASELDQLRAIVAALAERLDALERKVADG